MSLPKLKVEYPDGTDEVLQVRNSDVLRFEAHFQIPWISAFVAAQMAAAKGEDPELSMMVTYVWFLAYSAKTNGQGQTFEEWCDSFERVAFVMGEPEDDADPLDRTPTPGDSPA